MFNVSGHLFAFRSYNLFWVFFLFKEVLFCCLETSYLFLTHLIL